MRDHHKSSFGLFVAPVSYFSVAVRVNYVTRLRELALPLALCCLLATAGCAGVLGGEGGSNAHPTVGDDATLATVDAGALPADGDRYYPENDTVLAVASYDENGTPVEYNALPFEQYARFRCGSFARDETRRLLDEAGPNVRWVRYNVDDGLVRVFAGETVPETVRSALPDGVAVEVSIFDRGHTCRVPIVVTAEEPDPVA